MNYTPITLKQAASLIGKFSGLPSTPDKEQITLRIETLMNKARGIGHAERAMQDLLEKAQYFPSVRDIVEACEYSPDDQQLQSLRKDCPYCNGDGFRTVEGPYGTSAAFPCSHRAELTGPEKRLGVPLPAGVQRMYQAEAQRGAERRAAHEASGEQFHGSGYRRDLRRVTMAEIPRQITAAIEPPPLTEADLQKLRADLARAEQEYRDRKAREEIGLVPATQTGLA